MARRPCEIIAVDDGSTDGSGAELGRLASICPELRVVSLRQRSGQSAAVAAGFDSARGEVIATLDADGQNDPGDLTRLLGILENPPFPSAVAGFRAERHDSRWKQIQSRVANAVRDRITGDRVRDSACSLRVIRREAAAALPRFNGMHRFIPTLIRMRGGTVIQVPVRDRARWHGHSKYGMADRALRGLLDAFGVLWLKHRVLRYSVKPPGSP
jgi:glycosyltransferase involved in cell wall biosynthesis